MRPYPARASRGKPAETKERLPPRQHDRSAAGRRHPFLLVLQPDVEIDQAVAVVIDITAGDLAPRLEGDTGAVHLAHGIFQLADPPLRSRVVTQQAAQRGPGEPGIEKDIRVPAPAGELAIVVDRVKVLGTAHLLDHLGLGQEHLEPGDLLALLNIVPVPLGDNRCRHVRFFLIAAAGFIRAAGRRWPASLLRWTAPADQELSAATSSGSRWTSSVLRMVATSSPSWLVIRVSTAVQTAFGSSRMGFW